MVLLRLLLKAQMQLRRGYFIRLGAVKNKCNYNCSAGLMESAMSYPASDKGHEVRLVDIPLDGEIIEYAKETGYCTTLKKTDK